MTKMYNKSELKINNGYFCDADNNILYPLVRVTHFINQLFSSLNGKTIEEQIPGVEETVIDTEHSRIGKNHLVRFETPELDAEHERAMAMRNEIKMRQFEEEINKEIGYYEDVLDWLDSRTVPMTTEAAGIGITRLDYDCDILNMTSKEAITFMMLNHGLPENWDNYDIFSDVLDVKEEVTVEDFTKKEVDGSEQE